MDIDLGRLKASFIFDTSSFTAGVTGIKRDITRLENSLKSSLSGIGQDAQKQLGSIRQSFASFASQMQATGQGMLAVGTAITGGLGGAVKAATDFDRELHNVDSVAKLSTEALKDLHDNVLKIASDPNIRQGPKDLAAALYDVYGSGFSGAKALDVTEQSAKGASAGMTDTATSARILSAVLNSGIPGTANDAKTAMDILFREVDRGTNTFEQLATSIGQTLPVASAAKVPLQEVTAALALMTKQSISASQANTQIRQFLIQMQKPTDDAAKRMDKLGIGYGTAHIQAVGLFGAVKEIIEKTKGHEDQLVKILPRMESYIGFLALAKNAGKDFAEELNFANNSVGATSEALRRQNQAAGAQWDILKKQVEIVGIQMGEALLPITGKIVEGIRKAVEWFSHLDTGLRNNIVQFAALAGAGLVVGGTLLTVAGSLLPLVTAFTAAGPAIAVVGTALSGLALPITGVVAGIGLLAAAWVNDWGQIREVASEFLSWFRPRVAEAVNGAKELITTAWSELKASTSDVWPSMQGVIHDTLVAISDEIKAEIRGWAAVFKDTFEPIKAAVKGGMEIVGGSIKTALALAGGNLQVFLDFMKGDWNKAFFDIGKFTRLFQDGMGKIFKGGFDYLKGQIRANLQVIQNLFGFHLGGVRTDVQAAATSIQKTFSGFMQRVRDVLSAGLKLLSLDFKGAWEDFRRATNIGSANIIGTVRGMVSGIIQAVANLPSTLYRIASSAYSAFQSGFNGGSLVTGVIGAAHGAVNSEKSIFDRFPMRPPTPRVGSGGGGKSGKGGGKSKENSDAKREEEERLRDFEEYLHRIFALQLSEEQEERRHAEETVNNLKIGTLQREYLLNRELDAIKKKYQEKRAELEKQAREERQQAQDRIQARRDEIAKLTTLDEFARRRQEVENEFRQGLQEHPGEYGSLAELRQAKLAQIYHEQEAAIQKMLPVMQEFTDKASSGFTKMFEDWRKQQEQQRQEARRIAQEEDQRIADRDRYEYDTGQISLQQYRDRLQQRLQALQAYTSEWFRLSQQIYQLDQQQGQAAQKKEEDRMKQRAAAFQKFINPVQNILTGAFTSLFEKGPKQFFQDVLDGFKKMLEEMLAQLLAKAAIFGVLDLFTGGGASNILGSFGSFLGFDDAHNDRIARHWGFDFGNHFLNGIADFQTQRLSPVAAQAVGGSSQSFSPVVNINFHGTTIHKDVDIDALGDRLAYRTMEGLRGKRFGSGSR